jgi:hypothetical protein
LKLQVCELWLFETEWSTIFLIGREGQSGLDAFGVTDFAVGIQSQEAGFEVLRNVCVFLKIYQAPHLSQAALQAPSIKR